ncbi:MAG: hypothetical protein E7Z89_01485 [Cyanobacteria bacterium SIG28]|nr:hypothetical protein [Cyanobacteria bacterium SIG28]
MYQIKSRIYLDFDKTQKSGICNYLRALVKQNLELTSSELLEKFLGDEKYYLELNSSRFPFLSEVIDNDDFVQDTKLFIIECKRYYEYKESQRPFIEKQKEYEKKKRKFLQEVKMSKEKPTQKQIYYYDKLCKRYSLEKKDVENLSKLDLRDEIERIINEYSGFSAEVN